MPTFGYWDLRGLAHPIRFLLQYAGEKYEEKLYKLDGSNVEASRAIWLQDKFNLGLDFPNLPYYIDGDVKLTQSTSILRYIATKHNLMGKSAKQTAEIDVALMEAMDFRMAFARLCYNEKFEEMKKDAIAAQKPKVENLNKILEGKQFVCGEISVADFLMYESLYCWGELDPELISKNPNVQKYMERFVAIPQISAYMKSAEFIEGPMNSPTAMFNGKWKKP